MISPTTGFLLGVAIGALISFFTDNLGLGLAVGVSLGLAFCYGSYAAGRKTSQASRETELFTPLAGPKEK
jgi:hypothetical protein